ncbi:MAG: aminotransferase class IV [Gemmobacter sp.]|nr:aminotransferase class IV [Gemmobacter sp.]
MESPFRGLDLTGVALIETLLWDGAAFPLLPRHLARLATARAAFDWPPLDPEPALRAAVTRGAAQRVRLLAAPDTVQVTVATLPPAAVAWRVRLASVLLDPADPWLLVKSTRRAQYDADRAALPEGVDELIYANRRGEMCEGTITTLFFDAGQGLCTPPLACGCLPGCLRADLLATGRCHEAVLPVADLPRVRLWVGNAVRGLIPARLA